MNAGLVFAELTRERIREIAPRTLAVLPVASTEQHGPHLPVTTDTAICEAVARRAAALAAESIAVTVAPTVCYGSSHHHYPHPGVLSLSADTFAAVLADILDGLARSGFRRVFILNGHGGNETIARELAARASRAGELEVSAASYWQVAGEALRAEADVDALGQLPGHAGGFETSCILALRPDLVVGRPPEGGGPAARLIAPGQRPGDGVGYSDDASLASAQKGEQCLEIAAREVARRLVELGRGL